ncbi:CLUMA_CG001732, isoform A [Clunio marinus]|uniref:CLUMA_CG001732, isoform A n=1 Tax=Clunio marinus TaxID=568069 RepID=A0A1J1HK75_9DIPT|nr:CLUMA_CG001732, isoform A [Clunio marinus]
MENKTRLRLLQNECDLPIYHIKCPMVLNTKKVVLSQHGLQNEQKKKQYEAKRCCKVITKPCKLPLNPI